MFESVGRSFQLIKESYSVIGKDKEILLFPAISSIALVLVLVTFLVPFFAAGLFKSDILFFAVLFAFYFVANSVMYFFNAALVTCANIRLNGGDPTFMDGINNAFKHIGSILLWALISATVGVILQAISSSLRRSRNPIVSIVGRLFVSLLGAAWEILTFFVVPVIVLEEGSVFDAIKRSGETMKRTWGENAVGQISMGIIFLLIKLLAIPIVVLGFLMGGPALIGALAIAVLYWAIVSVFEGALNGVFTTALYLYAKNGKVGGYSPELIQGAFAGAPAQAPQQPPAQ